MTVTTISCTSQLYPGCQGSPQSLICSAATMVHCRYALDGKFPAPLPRQQTGRKDGYDINRLFPIIINFPVNVHSRVGNKILSRQLILQNEATTATQESQQQQFLCVTDCCLSQNPQIISWKQQMQLTTGNVGKITLKQPF